MKIYVPDYDNNSCVIIKDNETLRVYNNRPQNINEDYSYTDYFYNSHYYNINGSERFNSVDTLPVCLNFDTITRDIYYRNDIVDIFLIFLVLFIVGIILPLKLFSRFFRRLQ